MTQVDTVELRKRAAASRALDLISDGMVVGLGSGSTAAIFISLLGERVRAGLQVRCAVTSNQSELLARSVGIPLLDTNQSPSVDIDVDGADEIDQHLQLIKGAGGALLHEKLVAASSHRFVVIADGSKVVSMLGAHPVPVEVVSFYWQATAKRIERLGAAWSLRSVDGDVYVTDSGNHILDVTMPANRPAAEFAKELKATLGVVEHGIFIGMATLALIGAADGSVEEMSPAGN